MKKLAAGLLVLSAGLAVAQANVGMRLPSAMIPKNNRTVCTSSPSQFYPCLENVQVSGVRFTTVGYDARTHEIKYLFTQDDRFKTVEGLRVHGVITLTENEILFIQGWHIIGPRTKDGWRPILGTLRDGDVLTSADGEVVDLTKPVKGKMHRFHIVGFDKGGV